jgi:MFS family permease
MNRSIKWHDYISINIYWLGLGTLNNSMVPLFLPLFIQNFVGEAQKGTYYGNLRLWTLMVALLVQALMGMFSDRLVSKFGKRRPFIFLGTIAMVIALIGTGIVYSMEGNASYSWFLLCMLILYTGSNTAQAGQQALIPDLVPEDKRGRFSGAKSLFEVPLPVIIVSLVIAKLVGAGNYWGGLFILILVLIFVMFIALLSPESPSREVPGKLNWTPFLRLFLMTFVFTSLIVFMGEIVKFIDGAKIFKDVTLNAILLGLIGFIGMTIAIYAGVRASILISLGKKDNGDQNFSWWVINRLGFLVGVTNLGGFIVYYFQARLNYSGESAAGPAARLTMLIGIFILLSALISGWLADKIGKKKIIFASGLIAFTATVLIALTSSMSIIYVGGALLGISTGLFYTSSWALGTEIVPKVDAGKYLGIANLAGAGAGAIGAYIGGPIADNITISTGNNASLAYMILFLIYAALFLSSAFVLFGIKPAEK